MLARDWVIEAFVLVVAAHVVVYTVPLLDPDTLDWFGSTPFMVPYVLLALVAAFDGLSALGDAPERRFWSWIGTGCGVWLATLVVVSVVRLEEWSIAYDVVSDAAYMFFYVPILMAIELRPHVVDLDGRFTLERNLRWMGLAVVLLGWFTYFVLVPLLVDQGLYGTALPSTLLFLTIDLIMLLRFATYAWAAGRGRWRRLYGALAVASAALVFCDTLDALTAAGLLFLQNGRLTDLLWTVAPASFVVAFRLSRIPAPAGPPPTTASPHLLRSLDPVRVGSLLMAGAFTFPAGHFALHVLSDHSRAIELAQHAVALATMTILGGLAVIAYRRLEQQRSGHERDRVALEERLRQAQKLEAVGRVAGAVSHELGDALRAVALHVGRAVDQLGALHPISEALLRAQDAARRAATFAGNLHVVSRRQPAAPQAVDLNDAIRTTAATIRETAGARISVDLELAPDAGHVLVGLDAFHTVLTTLVMNASDAMPDGGTLLIETGCVVMEPDRAFAQALRPGRYGRLLVADTGAGIPSHVMGHLFEPFFTTKDRSGGVGLGLAMAYALVTQHGGHIGVRSEPGRGAEFEILLPAVDPAGAPARGRA